MFPGAASSAGQGHRASRISITPAPTEPALLPMVARVRNDANGTAPRQNHCQKLLPGTITVSPLFSIMLDSSPRPFLNSMKLNG